MRLELGYVLINDVQFGEVTKIEKGVLFVNKSELINFYCPLGTALKGKYT